MGYLFEKCQLLLSLPDITKWNIRKVTSNIENIFEGCQESLYIELDEILAAA
jgi:surface protein